MVMYHITNVIDLKPAPSLNSFSGIKTKAKAGTKFLCLAKLKPCNILNCTSYNQSKLNEFFLSQESLKDFKSFYTLRELLDEKYMNK